MRLKPLCLLIIAFVAANCHTVAYAQSSKDVVEVEKSKSEIIEKIEEESNGNIEIEISDDVLDLLIPDKKAASTAKNKPGGQVQTPTGKQGWRIQIFSDGRNQNTLQNRARARANAVTARFPKYRNQVYSFSKAPNWYTRIGNFKTQAEANAALAELRRAFPQFAAEMRVVKSQIAGK